MRKMETGRSWFPKIDDDEGSTELYVGCYIQGLERIRRQFIRGENSKEQIW